MNKKTFFHHKMLTSISLITLLTYGCGNKNSSTPQPKAIPVSTTVLNSSTLIDSTEFVGSLEAVERVNLAPKINGRIMNIFVEEGAIVNRGQLIAELEPEQQQEDVNAATANIQAQVASYNQSLAELRQTEAQRDSSSADVARLKASVSSAQANLKTAEANLESAIADLDLAQVNYERSVFLVEQGVLPEQDLDDKTRDLNTTKANVEAQRKTVDAFRSNVSSAQEALKSAQSNLAAAQERVESAKANVARSQANIDQAQSSRGSIEQNLVFTRLVAPIDGRVGDFQEFKLGDFLNVGQTLTTITNNRRFHLNLNIPTENINNLRLGLPVEIINADGSVGVKGAVTYIAPLVNQDNQSINIKITFENDGTLKDQQYVRTRLIWDTKPGILVPTNVVTSLGGQKFVFVAREGQSKDDKTTMMAHQVPIQVQGIQGQDYQVTSGIQEGDRIITNRILDLRDKTPISLQEVTSQVN